jgi:hypothetical protein
MWSRHRCPTIVFIAVADGAEDINSRGSDVNLRIPLGEPGDSLVGVNGSD